MFQKYIKRFCYVMVVVSLVFCNCVQVKAKMDLSQKGSLTLTLKDSESNVVPHGKYVLYYVGTIDKSVNSLGFIYTEEFKDNGMTLDNLKEEGLASHLAAYALNHQMTGMTQEGNENGVVSWNKLDLGLYLVVQTEHSDGYYAIDPFLISVPLSEDGVWNYDVKAYPKVEMKPVVPKDKEITVKKVWVHNGNKLPESIKVTLLKDHQVYDTCTLNEKNHWSYTWKNLSDEFQWTVSEVDVPSHYKVSYNYLKTEIIVKNTFNDKEEVPEIIETGQLNWPIPVLTCLGIVIFSIGWVMTFKKKDNLDEK